MGEIVLSNVNEVTTAVNAQNVLVSPNPTNTTPTASAAHLRLILHVDSGGQVRLLNSVAVINKSTNSQPNVALLTERGALVGASDHGSTKALYAKDPDDIEFEVSWLVPADRLDDEAVAAKSSIRPLDIAREKERYGGQTRGGVGVSTHV